MAVTNPTLTTLIAKSLMPKTSELFLKGGARSASTSYEGDLYGKKVRELADLSQKRSSPLEKFSFLFKRFSQLC